MSEGCKVVTAYSAARLRVTWRVNELYACNEVQAFVTVSDLKWKKKK